MTNKTLLLGETPVVVGETPMRTRAQINEEMPFNKHIALQRLSGSQLRKGRSQGSDWSMLVTGGRSWLVPAGTSEKWKMKVRTNLLPQDISICFNIFQVALKTENNCVLWMFFRSFVDFFKGHLAEVTGGALKLWAWWKMGAWNIHGQGHGSILFHRLSKRWCHFHSVDILINNWFLHPS